MIYLNHQKFGIIFFKIHIKSCNQKKASKKISCDTPKFLCLVIDEKLILLLLRGHRERGGRIGLELTSMTTFMAHAIIKLSIMYAPK